MRVCLKLLLPPLNELCDGAAVRSRRACSAPARKVMFANVVKAAKGTHPPAAVGARPSTNLSAGLSAPKVEVGLSIDEAFRLIDVNEDGSLSRMEIMTACRDNPKIRALLKLPQLTKAGFEAVFAQLDIDGSGEVRAPRPRGPRSPTAYSLHPIATPLAGGTR